MPHILRSRVAETSTTTGTGSIALAGAVAGHQTFAAAIAVGDTTEYAISAPDGSWEVGIGTLSASTTLARTTVIASSNAGSLVNLPAGSKTVALSPLATRLSAVPRGGTANQVLAKNSSTDFDAVWLTLGTGAFATIANYALLASPTFTGTPAAPTAAANTNTTQIATTAFVLGQANSTAATIAMNGTQAAGSSNLYARADHVHPVDTSRSPLAGSTSITTLGTITTGVWNGTAIAIANGGTGATSKAAAYNALTPITTLGDIVFGDGANSAARLAGNTTTSRRFLRQTGTGSASAAPAWDGLVDGDIPAALTGKTVNGLTLTANATGFSAAGGTTSKTLTVNNSITLAGTDGSTLNIGAGGTLGTGAFATIANYATLASPTFTGTPAGPTAAADTNTTQIATTAFVLGQASGITPLADGSASIGVSLRYARGDHRHPSDTSRAPLDSPAFSGEPTAPTAVSDTNTTQIATTAYVVGQGYLKSSTASSTYLALSGGTLTGDLTLSGTGRRIIADFSNATIASRAMFQSSTANGSTTVSAIPNGTGTAGQFAAYAGSDPANAPFGALLATASQIQIISNKNGTGTTQSLAFLIDGSTRATFGAAGALDLATGLREARVAMGASDIDLRAGNVFTRTISGTTTLTVSNVPAAGTAASFILDLTNGGSATVNWWSGTKWAGGTAPALTSSGRDVLGFFTHDAGTTWTGLLLGKDVK